MDVRLNSRLAAHTRLSCPMRLILFASAVVAVAPLATIGLAREPIPPLGSEVLPGPGVSSADFALPMHLPPVQESLLPEYRIRVDDEIAFVFRRVRIEPVPGYVLEIGDVLRVESLIDPTL